MRLLLNPFANPGGGLGPPNPGFAPPAAFQQQAPAGFQAAFQQQGGPNPLAGPVAAINPASLVAATLPTASPYQAPQQSFAPAYQPGFGVPAQFNPGGYGPAPAPTMAPGGYGNPIQVAGGQVPAGYAIGPDGNYYPSQGSPAPTGPPQPFQFVPGQPLPQQQIAPPAYPFQPPAGFPTGQPAAPMYQIAAAAPVGQQQPAVQGQNAGILATLPAGPVGPPATLQEAQQRLAHYEMDRINSLAQAGQTQQAIQQLQQHYQGQVQAAHQVAAQAQESLVGERRERAISDALVGYTFRDAQAGMNARSLLANSLLIGVDGQVRDQAGRPAVESARARFQTDMAIFLAPAGLGGGPTPQGQYPNPATPGNPNDFVGAALSRYDNGLAAQMAQYYPAGGQPIANTQPLPGYVRTF